MSTALAQASLVLQQQPFSRLLGARLTAFGEGRAVIELDLRDDLRQQNGYAHGGVLAYAADNALTFAAGTTLGPSILTTGFSIDYLRPATGVLLVAEAEVVETTRGRASAVCRLWSVDAEGVRTACAVALGGAQAVTPR